MDFDPIAFLLNDKAVKNKPNANVDPWGDSPRFSKDASPFKREKAVKNKPNANVDASSIDSPPFSKDASPFKMPTSQLTHVNLDEEYYLLELSSPDETLEA